MNWRYGRMGMKHVRMGMRHIALVLTGGSEPVPTVCLLVDC